MGKTSVKWLYGAAKWLSVTGKVALKVRADGSVTATYTHIGKEAFKECRIKEVHLPASLSSVEESAFEDCINLESIQGWDNLDKIESFAFTGCTKLSHLHLPNSISSLGGSLFDNCSKITRINLPDSIIDPDPFYIDGHNNITHVSVSESNIRFREQDGAVYSKDKRKLVFAPRSVTGTFTVNEVTEEILCYAFQSCMIEKVILPNRLKTIDPFAFAKCTLLNEINFPNSLESIGAYAFSGCSSLMNVILPENTRDFGSSPFAGCSSLKRFRVYAESALSEAFDGFDDSAYPEIIIDPVLPASAYSLTLFPAAAAGLAETELTEGGIKQEIKEDLNASIRSFTPHLYFKAVENEHLLKYMIINHLLEAKDIEGIISAADKRDRKDIIENLFKTEYGSKV